MKSFAYRVNRLIISEPIFMRIDLTPVSIFFFHSNIPRQFHPHSRDCYIKYCRMEKKHTISSSSYSISLDNLTFLLKNMFSLQICLILLFSCSYCSVDAMNRYRILYHFILDFLCMRLRVLYLNNPNPTTNKNTYPKRRIENNHYLDRKIRIFKQA